MFDYPGASCLPNQFNWAVQTVYFAQEMKRSPSPLANTPQPWTNTYFEIENEPNARQDWSGSYTDRYGTLHSGLGWGYVNTFVSTAPLLNAALNSNGLGNGRILTGGVVVPDSGLCAPNNIIYIEQAINDANSWKGVPPGRLGVAVHPYGYTTTDEGSWQNYKGQLGFTTTTCTSLGSMIGNWEDAFPNMPKSAPTRASLMGSPGHAQRQVYHRASSVPIWDRVRGA